MVAYNHTKWQEISGEASDKVTLNPARGPAFDLVSRPGAQVNLIERQVFTAAVTQSRNALDRVHGIVLMRLANTPLGTGIVPADFDHMLDYCFRPAATAVARRQTLIAVRDNLVKIRNGLWTPSLQIVDKNPNRAGNASGYVRQNFVELVRRRNVARPLGFTGRIHMRFSLVNTGNTPVNQATAALTITHEAAHKFTGARDWIYNAGGSIGYIAILGLALGGPIAALAPLTNAEGINNADSYAEFVHAMP